MESKIFFILGHCPDLAEDPIQGVWVGLWAYPAYPTIHRLSIHPSHNVFGTRLPRASSSRQNIFYKTCVASPSDSCANVDPGDAPRRPLVKESLHPTTINALQVIPNLSSAVLNCTELNSALIHLEYVLSDSLSDNVLLSTSSSNSSPALCNAADIFSKLPENLNNCEQPSCYVHLEF